MVGIFRSAIVMKLLGKTIFLTGAATGIGHETLKALTAKGCEVIVLGRESARLAALENQPGIKAMYHFDLANLAEAVTRSRSRLPLWPTVSCALWSGTVKKSTLIRQSYCTGSTASLRGWPESS